MSKKCINCGKQFGVEEFSKTVHLRFRCRRPKRSNTCFLSSKIFKTCYTCRRKKLINRLPSCPVCGAKNKRVYVANAPKYPPCYYSHNLDDYEIEFLLFDLKNPDKTPMVYY